MANLASMSSRLALGFAVATFSAAVAVACASATMTVTTTDLGEAGADGASDGGADGPVDEEDGAVAVTDSGDAGKVQIDGPGEAGTECAFNRECNAALRCECSESAGCACKAGARGTGMSGVTPCADGNDCASSVCVEGPPDSGTFCSDECTTSADCTGKLPLCSDIAFVGRICIRQPPM